MIWAAIKSSPMSRAEFSSALYRIVIQHLPATTDIRVGDLLVTSGLGGRFPHGYPVARVTEVIILEGDAFATVFAAPSSLLDRGRYVLVVMWGDRQRETAP